MDLLIRSLRKNDNIENIFELCKQNNLIAPFYATNIDIWNFQYINNPMKKSWNSILINKEDSRIYGHIGLVPTPMKIFSVDCLAGFISNGVIAKSARNKLLPFNKIKTFAITPLIDCCSHIAFDDGVDFIFAYSTIHPMIWRSLKYNEIHVDLNKTYHSSIKCLYMDYCNNFNQKYKTRPLVLLVKPYSLFLTSLNVISNLVISLVTFMDLIKFKIKKTKKITCFDSEFDNFFTKFYQSNPDIITYKRDASFLSWRFNNNCFLKFCFEIDGVLAGYIILEKMDGGLTSNSYSVLDCIVLDEYLSYTPSLFRTLNKSEKINIIFDHYLSCDYSHKLYKKCLRQGYVFSVNPFRKFMSVKKKYEVPNNLYYKVGNDADLTEAEKNKFTKNSWFITPIIFCPKYYPS